MIELGALQVDFFDPSQQLLDSLDTTDLKKDSSPRFIHVDLGIRRDRAAIACTKIVGAVNQQRRDPTSNLTVVTRDPVYVTEFVLFLEPKPGHDIPIMKIKNFIIDLRDVVRLSLQLVTTDGYQSENLRQDLTLVGIKTALQSVDRTREPYDLIKDAMLERSMDRPGPRDLEARVERPPRPRKKDRSPDYGPRPVRLVIPRIEGRHGCVCR